MVVEIVVHLSVRECTGTGEILSEQLPRATKKGLVEVKGTAATIIEDSAIWTPSDQSPRGNHDERLCDGRVSGTNAASDY